MNKPFHPEFLGPELSYCNSILLSYPKTVSHICLGVKAMFTWRDQD